MWFKTTDFYFFFLAENYATFAVFQIFSFFEICSELCPVYHGSHKATPDFQGFMAYQNSSVEDNIL